MVFVATSNQSDRPSPDFSKEKSPSPKHGRGILSLLFLTLVSSLAWSKEETFTLSPKDSKISFIAHGTLGSSFSVPGTFDSWTGFIKVTDRKYASAKIEVTIDIKSINTGTARRDKHLKEKDFFWAHQYPTAHFTSTKITHKTGNQYLVLGLLTIRGITKEIQVPMILEKNKITGKMAINRREYGMHETTWFFLPKVEDEVELELLFVVGGGNI